MSKKSQWKLTENGVLALYEETFKNEVRVQVIFLSQIDSMFYLRVSDGRHLSPVVFAAEEVLSLLWFNVGAIIDISERRIIPYDESSENGRIELYLEDNALPHIFIESISLVADSHVVRCVLGSLDRSATYRDNIRDVLPVLKKWYEDEQEEELRWEFDGIQAHLSQLEGGSIREQGNAFFKHEGFSEAIAFYDMAKVKDPYDCRVWFNCSQAHFKVEEYLYAELHALVAMKINPFYEKAYYRAGQAALKDKRRDMGEMYAMKGIFLCGETKDLRQILEDSKKLPREGAEGFEGDDLNYFFAKTQFLHSLVRKSAAEEFASASFESIKNQQKLHSLFTKKQDQLMRKKYAELNYDLGREQQKRENKKVNKKNKKPAYVEELAAAVAAAEVNKEQDKKCKEEEKKNVQELKKEDKNHKPIFDLQEALGEGRRLFQTDHFHQAIVMYSKCLTYNEGTYNTNNAKGKTNERCDARWPAVTFILGMCKVQCIKGFIYEGLETMKALCQDNSKFPHKPAARYWLAVSFEKICRFKLAEKQAQLCKEALKKLKSFKPIKWPGTEQPITCTLREELENNCKILLDRPSSARPSAKAKCRYKNCITTQGISYAKEQIYLEDPDFKGYLNVVCEENCTVSYHPCCWKAFKEQHNDSGNRMSDKDFLGEVCVTPDCTGKITSILIFDDVGELKNELVKDKKEKRNMAATGKQKKKKDKKKEKAQAYKKRTRVESACEDQAINEDTSPVAAESTTLQNDTSSTSNNNNSNSTNHGKHKSSKPALPIDLESLEKAHVTILKPGTESEAISPLKSTKNKKKKKVKKPANQHNLLGDPLEDELCVQNEYIGRLRMLRQQRDALEAGELPSPMKPTTVTPTTAAQNPVMLLDPDNPFYLPQHLRDNPEELENVLQEKLTTSSPPGLQQETINTLLDFMYDWLKSEGPMHTNDSRLTEQVAENFPQEARDYVSQCGGITGLLMQSIKFALIDGIVCVHDDVMKAQEKVCREVSDKMVRSKYLSRYSDGQKAKRYTHLLDDAKSTCSTASSSSQLAGSVAESGTSRDSRRHHHNHHDNDNDSSASFAPLSKSIVDQMNAFCGMSLNPAAPAFEPVVTNAEEKDDDDEEEEEEEEEEAERQWNKNDSEYIKNWAAQAGEEVHLIPEEEEEEEEDKEDEEKKEEEEEEEEGNIEEEEEEVNKEEEEEEVDKEEEEEEEQGEQDEGDEEVIDDLQEEEDEEETEQYINQLQEERDDLQGHLENEQQQNQKLSDKLYQVKSQYKSEVMTLKQQLEELRDQNNELTSERNTIQTQKDADAKKHKTDLSRNTEETKSQQSRLQSLELKSERFLDLNNELQANLVDSMVANTQLKEELEKMKNLQESLTSCSRRAREAEVKYLSIKKDLVDANMSRTISRLSEEAVVMRKLLPGVTDDSVPDRKTVTRTIVAWDEAIKTLMEQQRVFKDESNRLLGMIHQGRPLSALPSGELVTPAIPNLTVAPLLSLFKVAGEQRHTTQNLHQMPPPCMSLLGMPEALAKDAPRHPSPGPQPPPHLPMPMPNMTEPPPQVPLLPVPVPLMQAPPLNGHPMFMHNGGPPPPHHGVYASGAIPKATPATPATHPAMTSENLSQAQQTDPPPNQLFAGQLPWEFSETDVKNLFSRFGEVVSVNVFDKGRQPDGRLIPKYGFITFRNPEDCLKALSARPIFVGNHMINVQAKEPKKPTKPASVPATVAGGGGGGGLASVTKEPDANNGTKSAAYGLPDITVNANVEANKSAAAHHHHTLPTPTTLHHHQPPPPPTSQSSTKPKFQRLLPTNNAGGSIGAPPPKLVRPQAKVVPNASKTGGQASAVKEESAMPASSSYTRLIEVCKHRFSKEFSSPDICTALREVRMQNNNSLSGLTTDKIVERVRQQLRSRRPGAGAATVAPWAGITQGSGAKTEPVWQGPNKEEVVKEDSCSICLEPLNSSPSQTLACQHTFHALCIKDWIKIQSNCPNCRKFALMPNEYPKLSHN